MHGQPVDELTALVEAGVPTTALGGQPLGPVAVTAGEAGAVAHRPGWCGTSPAAADVLPLSAVQPLAADGVALCTGCRPAQTVLPAPARAWIAAARSAHGALRAAETALLRPVGHPNLRTDLAQQLGALALAPLGAASSDPSVLGSDAGWFTDRAAAVAAAREDLLEHSAELVGDDALAELAAPYAVTAVDDNGRRAPDADRVTAEIAELLPADAWPPNVTSVWAQLLDWPWLSWRIGQVARVCATLAGRDADDAQAAEEFDDVAAALLELWDEPIARAQQRRTAHLVAASAVEPGPLFACSPRRLLSVTLAGRSPLVCVPEDPAAARMSALLVVPQVLAEGLAVADRRCVALGPLQEGDGPGTWRALAALWAPASGGPLADPAAALAAARGVAAG